MTRYLLDTNIVSNVTKVTPSPSLIQWMSEQNDDDLYIATMTLAEIRRGVFEKPEGRKRRDLEQWLSGPDGPATLFAGRVLAFDEKSAEVWARLMADGTVRGRPRSALDMIIAAVAQANNCVIVTDNERDFAGLEMINPLKIEETR